MKNLIIIICFFAFAGISNAQVDETMNVNIPEMTFEQDFFDLGPVHKGEKRKLEFRFENSGNAPMVIENISACSCTEVEYEEGKTYQPGEGDILYVTFDSSDKDESETIEIDIYLEGRHPVFDVPLVFTPKYKFELIK